MAVSPELTGGAGFTFEDSVAAYYLAALLTERGARGLTAAVPARVTLQRGALGRPLDDVVVSADTPLGPLTLDMQVKRSFVFRSSASNTDLFEIVDRAHQTITKPSFRVGFDRVGVATDDINIDHYRQVRTVCDWARDSVDAADFLNRIEKPDFASQAKRNVVTSTRVALQQALKRPATDDEVHTLLRHFVLLRFDLLGEGAADLDLVLDRISGNLSDPIAGAADDVWITLRTVAREASGQAGGFERLGLLARLGRPERFSPALRLAPDLERLNGEARLALSTIEHSIDGLVVPRDALAARVQGALKDHRIVQLVGQPGSGKSALLRGLVETHADTPLIALRADRLVDGGWPAYAQRLGLTHATPLPLLREMAANGDPVLVIDGIDRVPKAQRALILEIVDAVLGEPGLARWRIIVTLRDGSWAYVSRWLLLARTTLSQRIEVGNLDETEAKFVAQQRPRLQPLLFGAPAVQEIARRPFFLNVLASAIDLDAQTPSSETELLAAWWAGGGYDAEGADRRRRQETLVALARGSAATLGRTGRVRALDKDAVESLRDDGVLRDAEPGHTVSFNHDIFFEWAFTHSLIDAEADWVQTLVEAGEPPALGRPVELLSQMRFERDQTWEAEFDRLDGGAIRSQWRRSWLIAPLSSPLFELHSKTFSDTLFRQDDGRRLRHLLLWFQAVRTDPSHSPYAGALGELSETERIRLADALASPSDYPAWRRLLLWTLSEQARLPPGLWGEVLTCAEVWQNALVRYENPVSEGLLQLVETWLGQLDDHRRPEDARSFPGRFDMLSHDEEKTLTERLRTLLFRGAVAYPAFSQRYLQRLIDLPALAHDALDAVIASAAWVARASPKLLAELVLTCALERLPKAQMSMEREEDENARQEALSHPAGSRERDLLMPSGLGGGIDYWDWDHLSIDRLSHQFYPPTPVSEPFHALFQEDPDEALKLVKALANHAVAAWRELHELDPERGRTPLPLDLDFPWGRQTFWGEEREYFAFRATFAPAILEAGLMVLEEWAFGQLESGADLGPLLRRVIEHCQHNAILGVACALALGHPQATLETLTLVGAQRLWRWDMARLVRIDNGVPANEIGALGRRRLLAPLKRANQRPARALWIGNLSSLFVLTQETALAEAFAKALAGFAADPALDFADEADDEGLVADRLRTGARWADLARPERYSITETDEGFRVETQPQPPADAIEEAQAQVYDHTTRWMALAMWSVGVFEPQGPKSNLSNAAAIAEARALDAPDLFVASPELGDLEDLRRTGVAGGAAAVLMWPEHQDPELLDWAEGVMARALRCEVGNDGWITAESILSFHPLKYVGYGLAGLVRRGRSTRAATDALIGLSGHFVHEISVAAAKAAYGVFDVAPDLAAAVLQFVVALSVRPDTPLQRWRDATAANAIRFDQADAAHRAALAVGAGQAPFELPALPASDGWGEDGKRLSDHPWLDTAFLDGHLPLLVQTAFNADMAGHVDRLAERLLNWTIQRTVAGGRRREAGRMITWRGVVMPWIAARAGAMTADAVLAELVAPIAALEDEPCIQLLGPFIGTFTAREIHDASVLKPRVMEILIAAAHRVAAIGPKWRNSYDADATELMRELMCVPSQYAGGASRFANGDWTDVAVILPVVDILFARLADRPDFARTWVALVEASVDYYPIDRFAVQARTSLEMRRSDQQLEETFGSRVGALVQAFMEREESVDKATRDNLLRVLDLLVDSGDRRSAALQRSALFRSAQRGPS